MLLIHPPQVRNCEPPVALTRLAGALSAAGEQVTILDGALEGYLWLTRQPAGDPGDLQAKRVRRNQREILTFPSQISSLDRYKKKIADIKLLAESSLPVKERGIQVSPADYQDPRLSPLRSSDLQYSWEHPRENIYYPWFSERIGSLLEKENHRFVGISVGYLSQALSAMAICGFIKKQYPGIKIQLGGSLINSWNKGPSDIAFLTLLADQIQTGEGEEGIVRFAGREFKGFGIPFFDELYDRQEGQDYLSPERVLPYSASLGCSWKRCTFCSEKWENNDYKGLSLQSVSENLAELVRRHNPGLIHFCDNEISPALMAQMIEEPPGPAWYGFSRFIPEMTHSSYCRGLAGSGCRMLCLGLESGDQEVLNRLGKGIRLELVSRILENLKEAGIKTYVYLLFGTPSEDRAAAFRTRDFILKHRDNIDFLNLSIFNMPIGSSEASSLKTGTFYQGDLTLYTGFSHPSGWDRRSVRLFLQKEFRKVPELGAILKRTPPVFTANHASFVPV